MEKSIYILKLVVATLLFMGIQHIDAQKYRPISEYNYPNNYKISTSEYKISVFPNPVSKLLYIKFNEETISYSIIDVLGQTIESGVLCDSRSVDVTSLKNGMYFIKLSSNHSEEIVRFIKN